MLRIRQTQIIFDLAPTPCTPDDASAISGSDCQCDNSSGTNECTVGEWCWSDNTCQANLKPTACVMDDANAITGADCQCDTSSTTAECVIGKYCITGNSCSDNPSKPIIFLQLLHQNALKTLIVFLYQYRKQWDCLRIVKLNLIVRF